MKPNKNPLAWFALLFVVLLGAWLAWWQEPSPIDPVPATGEAVSDPEEPGVLPGPVESEPELEPTRDSRRSVKLPAKKPGIEPERRKKYVHVQDGDSLVPVEVVPMHPVEITLDNILSQTRGRLKKVLDGNLEAAYALNDLRMRCHSHLRDRAERYQHMLDSKQHQLEAYKAIGQTIPPEGLVEFDPMQPLYPTEEQNRAHVDRFFAVCDQLAGIFSPGLRQKLDRLAQDGHVVARYAYATWPPEDHLHDSYLEDVYEWQLKALEYSHTNLEEGEVAGLLAFGQSYDYRLFTRYNEYMYLVFFHAALECGFDSERLAWDVEMNYGRWTRNTEGAPPGFAVEPDYSLEEMLALVDSTTLQYCR